MNPELHQTFCRQMVITGVRHPPDVIQRHPVNLELQQPVQRQIVIPQIRQFLYKPCGHIVTRQDHLFVVHVVSIIPKLNHRANVLRAGGKLKGAGCSLTAFCGPLEMEGPRFAIEIHVHRGLIKNVANVRSRKPQTRVVQGGLPAATTSANLNPKMPGLKTRLPLSVAHGFFPPAAVLVPVFRSHGQGLLVGPPGLFPSGGCFRRQGGYGGQCLFIGALGIAKGFGIFRPNFCLLVGSAGLFHSCPFHCPSPLIGLGLPCPVRGPGLFPVRAFHLGLLISPTHFGAGHRGLGPQISQTQGDQGDEDQHPR